MHCGTLSGGGLRIDNAIGEKLHGAHTQRAAADRRLVRSMAGSKRNTPLFFAIKWCVPAEGYNLCLLAARGGGAAGAGAAAGTASRPPALP